MKSEWSRIIAFFFTVCMIPCEGGYFVDVENDATYYVTLLPCEGKTYGACPLLGSIAFTNCRPDLPSYDRNKHLCQLPKKSFCKLNSNGSYGCTTETTNFEHVGCFPPPTKVPTSEDLYVKNQPPSISVPETLSEEYEPSPSSFYSTDNPTPYPTPEATSMQFLPSVQDSTPLLSSSTDFGPASEVNIMNMAMAINILNLTNKFRSWHGIPPLNWNSTISETVQVDANKCPGFHHVGNGIQNLGFIVPCTSVCNDMNPIIQFYDEVQTWNFDTNQCNTGSYLECGHFQNMMDPNVVSMGCGASKCGEQSLLWCNYQSIELGKVGTIPNPLFRPSDYASAPVRVVQALAAGTSSPSQPAGGVVVVVVVAVALVVIVVGTIMYKRKLETNRMETGKNLSITRDIFVL